MSRLSKGRGFRGQRKGKDVSGTGITRRDVFNMLDIATGGNRRLANNIFDVYRRRRSGGGGSLKKDLIDIVAKKDGGKVYTSSNKKYGGGVAHPRKPKDG